MMIAGDNGRCSAVAVDHTDRTERKSMENTERKSMENTEHRRSVRAWRTRSIDGA